MRVLKCAALECAGVRHAFSTRVGGVSEGVFASMNLGLHRGDSEAAVRENYSRFYAANGFAGALHRVTQVHGAKSVL
ncbi:MAG: laccase domain-containing protein, partial [Christensenella sp.]